MKNMNKYLYKMVLIYIVVNAFRIFSARTYILYNAKKFTLKIKQNIAVRF